MKKPQPRREVPPRSNENTKRRLYDIMESSQLAALFDGMKYEGSPKHKRHPHLFGLTPFRGERDDRTLCDTHAGFGPDDRARIMRLLGRAQSASLVGNFIWTIDDNGWIYELTVTNISQNQHHGYPLRPGEAITQQVFSRFEAWASPSYSPHSRDSLAGTAQPSGIA